MENNADQLPGMQSANCQNFFHVKQTEMDLFFRFFWPCIM